MAAAALGWFVAPGNAAAEVRPVIQFHSVQYDSPGIDNRSAESLNQEWISIVNTGRQPVNLHRWSVRDDAGHSYAFGNLTLQGSARVWLHTGRGKPTGRDVFWGSGNYIWNNTGDTAQLRDATGHTVDDCTWTALKGRTWVAC